MPIDCIELYKICVYNCKTSDLSRPINLNKNMSTIDKFNCLFFLRIFEQTCKPISNILFINTDKDN